MRTKWDKDAFVIHEVLPGQMKEINPQQESLTGDRLVRGFPTGFQPSRGVAALGWGLSGSGSWTRQTWKGIPPGEGICISPGFLKAPGKGSVFGSYLFLVEVQEDW